MTFSRSKMLCFTGRHFQAIRLRTTRR